MKLFSKIKAIFATTENDPMEFDPVGLVMSQLYDDILSHREELAREDRGEYAEYVEQAQYNIHLLAPDEESQRAVMVLLAESLKDTHK